MTKDFNDYNFDELPIVKKLFYLFLISYLFLYIFPFPLDFIPLLDELALYYMEALDWVSLHVGKEVLKIRTIEKIEMTGSGDTTFDYVKILTLILISVLFSLTIFACRKRIVYKYFSSFIIIYARYYIGINLLDYGFAKIYGGQFIYPDLIRLDTLYGDSSPMGLLWTFMGYSKSYTFFIGISEIIGGGLILFRRTMVLGSLITMAVMLNVVIMNFCYDVPVKIFSSHLLIITLFIFYPYSKALYEFLILHKFASIKIHEPIVIVKLANWVKIGLKILIIIGIPSLSIFQEITYLNEEGFYTKHSLSGAYKINTFILNKDTLLPADSDSRRWNKIILENDYAKINITDDSSLFYNVYIDSINKTLTFNLPGDSSENYNFNYEKNSNDIVISGLYKSDSVQILLKKDSKKYQLINSKFHWINEYPNNY